MDNKNDIKQEIKEELKKEVLKNFPAIFNNYNITGNKQKQIIDTFFIWFSIIIDQEI